MIEHNYTYLHGEKVTVLESELIALKLLEYSIEEKIGLPVNYCSFVYKNRYQKSAARRRHALKMIRAGESITESGFIRRMSFIPENSADYEKLLKTNGFYFDNELNDLLFSSSYYSIIQHMPGRVKIEYFVAQPAPQQLGTSEFKMVMLNENRNIGIERILALPEIVLEQPEAIQFSNYINGNRFYPITDHLKWINLTRFENIEEGLQDYF